MSVSRNVSMFGFEDIDGYVESVMNSLTFKFSGMNMVVMSLMSDAQEQMERGDTESARQTLNVSKYLLSLKK